MFFDNPNWLDTNIIQPCVKYWNMIDPDKVKAMYPESDQQDEMLEMLRQFVSNTFVHLAYDVYAGNIAFTVELVNSYASELLTPLDTAIGNDDEATIDNITHQAIEAAASLVYLDVLDRITT